MLLTALTKRETLQVETALVRQHRPECPILREAEGGVRAGSGSRNLSRSLPMTLSPASIRNVMSDLEHAGLIFAPHTSAGRLPTDSGLRLFVDGLLEVGHLTAEERRTIEALGLHRLHHTVIHADVPQIRGMVHKVAHLVSVEEVK